MADFSLSAIHQYWSEHHDKFAYQAILKLEAREQWAMDSDEKVDAELLALAKKINNKTQTSKITKTLCKLKNHKHIKT